MGAHKKNKFEIFLSNLEAAYKKFLEAIFNKNKLIIGIVISSLLVSYLAIKMSPGELLPREDRSLLGVYVPPQPGKNMDAMENYEKKISSIVGDIPEKDNYLTFIGHWGMSLVAPLVPHEKRVRGQREIVASLEPIAKTVPSIDVYPWGYESGIINIGSARDANNVTFSLLTTGTYKDLAEASNKLLGALNASGKFIYAVQDSKFDSQKFDIIIDKTKFAELGINPLAASRAINTMFSGNQTMEFQKDDTRYPITIEGDKSPWSLNEIYIIGNDGTRIPMGAFAKMQANVSMSSLKHHNQMRAANFTAMPMPPNNVESTMSVVEEALKSTLPNSFMINWTGSAEMQKEASGTMTLLFMMALIFIYAILAIQFNSFVDPIIIMFTVPLACSGALLMNFLFGFSINVYTQIGLITLVGLITKHGILMVEFANQLREKGEDIKSAIMHSSKLRLRPILMTTGAMILGAVPLIIASGAGAEARHAIGVVLVSGLGFGTIFTLFVLPKIYYLIKSSI
jgi:multidrug efflux pump